MKERFSAPGSSQLWLEASKRALEKAGFTDIQVDDSELTLKANGEAPFQIDLLPQPSQVELTLIYDSEEDNKKYKQTVPQEVAVLKQVENQEALGGIPENLKPDMESRFQPAFTEEEIIQEKTPPPVTHTPTATVIEAKKEPFYKTDWFVLFMLILIPPVGLYLVWHFKFYKDKTRKIISVVFIFYTILWLWLLSLVFLPPAQREQHETIVEVTDQTTPETGAVSQLNAYWAEPTVVNYVSQMPNLISAFDNLISNSEIGTADGNQQALEIIPQIQGLASQVLTVPAVSQDSAAYALQLKVNESAQTLIDTTTNIAGAINSGDTTALMNALPSWTSAENVYYEITYVYEQAMQAAQSTDTSAQTDPAVTGETENAEEIITEDLP